MIVRHYADSFKPVLSFPNRYNSKNCEGFGEVSATVRLGKIDSM